MQLMFINCSTKSSNSTSPTPTVYDPWNPPVGEAVAGGLATAEGWSSPYFLAPPVNQTTDGGWTDSVAVSRDGRRLFFAYSKRNGEQYLFNGGTEVIDGPARTTENNTKYLQIFYSDLTETGFSVTYSQANGSDSVDLAAPAINADQDLMSYTEYGGAQLIKLAAFSGGAWTQLGNVAAPVNGVAGTNCKDDNSFLIGNATSGTIYWQSRRVDIQGTDCSNPSNRERIYFATVLNGAVSAAQEVPGLYTATSRDYEASFSEDQSKAYWTRVDGASFGIYTADWNVNSFTNARPIIWINNFSAPWENKIVDIGEPNVVELSEGYVMYFRCLVALGTSGGQPSNRQFKICVSKKNKS